MQLRAVSIDRALVNAMRRGTLRGEVLSAHRNAAYLDRGDGSLIVLAREEVGNGPGFVLVPGVDSFSEGPGRGIPLEPFASGDGVISLGGGRMIIGTEGAVPWDAALRVRARAGGARECAEAALGIARSRRPRGVLGPLIDGLAGIAGGEPSPGCGIVEAGIRLLARALAQGDGRAIAGAAAALIGLGDGLTPSCDDMLAGIAGFFRCAAEDPASGARGRAIVHALETAVGRSGGRTTPVSRYFLGEALRGRFTERTRDLLEALAAGGEKRVAMAAERVLEYGATSGMDLVFGIALAAVSAARREKEGT